MRRPLAAPGSRPRTSLEMTEERMTEQIQAIVTDLGQVLLRFDQEPCWAKILAACDHPEARQQFREAYTRAQIGCGRTEPEIFFREAAAAMRMRMSYADFCVAWSDMFWEDPEVIELIARAP